MSFPAIFTVLAGILSLILFLRFVFTRKTGDVKAPPRAAGALPIIGHLHLLSGEGGLPHRVLASLGKKYGPIFTLNLGAHEALVVNSAEMARECYTTNDKSFADRPRSAAVELLGYNFASFGFVPYGPYWRGLRKIAVLDLLSPSRLRMLSHVRTSEVKFLMSDLYKVWAEGKGSTGKVVVEEMEKRFETLVFNVVLRMIAGRRYTTGDKEGDHVKNTIKDYVHELGTVVVGDVIPWLRWLDFSFHRKVKKTAEEYDVIMEDWLREQREKMSSGKPVDPKDEVFVASLLTRLNSEQDKDLSVFDKGTIVKATCSTIIGGAADTTTVALTWTLALLVNHPEVLNKAQEEIETHVGRERVVEESDLKNLVYLNAVIKESLRLYPPGAIIAPHQTVEDCIVAGYKVKKGTRLMVNLWNIQRDPEFWPQPEEYKPERFLTTQKDIDVWGQSYEFFPFSSGRRTCPGIGLAVQSMQLTLATLLQGFAFETPTGEPTDMSEHYPGMITSKATPLSVLISPRLAPEFYN
ncbi:unnamed protein product [Lactuca virosa]|uniref:Uncharacterized protein n=1 Tax=Lactuca virosa TaxID=75947 RepID=A0AAU9NYG2_9ASTR|nr:unnamed protein product [Lactuca virosa]